MRRRPLPIMMAEIVLFGLGLSFVAVAALIVMKQRNIDSLIGATFFGLIASAHFKAFRHFRIGCSDSSRFGLLGQICFGVFFIPLILCGAVQLVCIVAFPLVAYTFIESAATSEYGDEWFS